jgi:hypothetical protein
MDRSPLRSKRRRRRGTRSGRAQPRQEVDPQTISPQARLIRGLRRMDTQNQGNRQRSPRRFASRGCAAASGRSVADRSNRVMLCGFMRRPVCRRANWTMRHKRSRAPWTAGVGIGHGAPPTSGPAESLLHTLLRSRRRGVALVTRPLFERARQDFQQVLERCEILPADCGV